MLFLVFNVGEDRYALNTAEIAEVLPMVHLKRIPHAPKGVAGVFDYRGSPVPAIDLSDLVAGEPADARLSTRLIVVEHRTKDNRRHALGLIAERATDTIRRNPMDFAPSGVSNPDSPYLGPVLSDPKGMIQWVDAGRLLPASLQEMLFTDGID